MLKNRIERLEKIYKPSRYDMPLVIDEVEGGYKIKGRSGIVTEAELDELLKSRNPLPGCPAVVRIVAAESADMDCTQVMTIKKGD